MPGRVQVKLATNLVIDDQQAMREAAYERLRSAWSSDEDFPYASASDVPFDEVVHSLVADAVPLELAGCRRSTLEVEVGQLVEQSGDATAAEDPDAGEDAGGQEDQDAQDAGKDTDDKDTEDTEDTEDSQDEAKDADRS